MQAGEGTLGNGAYSDGAPSEERIFALMLDKAG